MVMNTNIKQDHVCYLGYCAPQDNFQEGQVVFKESLNAKQGNPKQLFRLCENVLFSWQPIADLKWGCLQN